MREADVVGLGSFVLAGKEKLCLIRPKGDALALETLFLAEDVKSQDEIDEPVAATRVKKEELALARQIIAGPRGRRSSPEELRSDYRASLRELLEAKLEGHELAAPVPAEDGGARGRPDGGAPCLGRRGRSRAPRPESPARPKRAAAGARSRPLG